MKDIDVLVIGRACVDYIALLDQFPQENKKIPMDKRLMEAGGQGSTSSCCISRLGGNVAYFGRIGNDKAGRFCLKRLKDFNVNTDYIEIAEDGTTPIAYIFVTKPSGKRTIIYEPYKLDRLKINDKIRESILSAKVMLLDPEVTYLHHDLSEFDLQNCPVIYDCERWRDGITEMMKFADYFIPSSDFFDTLTDIPDDISFHEKIKILGKMVKGQLIVTNGGDGVYFIENQNLYHIKAPEIKIRDTIGAGDNFHAAFAFGISKDFNLTDSIKFAVSVASLSCREYGGRQGIPEFNEARIIAEKLEIEAINIS